MTKYNYQYTENDYKTPPELYTRALKYFDKNNFSLDACCSDKHIPAHKHYMLPDNNGLIEEWRNYTWCNPPFDNAKAWVKKAYEENLKGKIIAMLLPVRTETDYWKKYILNNPSCTVDFLRKGYKFINNKGEEMGVFKNALALVYFENNFTDSEEWEFGCFILK